VLAASAWRARQRRQARLHRPRPHHPERLPHRLGRRICLAAKSIAVAALWRARGGEGRTSKSICAGAAPAVPFYDRKWEKLNGYPPRNPADPETPFSLAFYETRDQRWVMPLNLYPRLKTSALRLLDCATTRRPWRTRSANGSGRSRRGRREGGVVMPMIRSAEEFLAERHYLEALQGLPLIEIEKIGESRRPFTPNPSAPLSGIRALGLARVMPGGHRPRTGAARCDVLTSGGPPTSRSTCCTHRERRRALATLDVASTDGAAKMRELLLGPTCSTRTAAPVFWRATVCAARGRRAAAGHHPRSVSCTGRRAVGRPAGFDQSAGCVSGVVTLEGTPQARSCRHPRRQRLPRRMAVTTGIVAALLRRAREGGSYRVHVSLTRLSCGSTRWPVRQGYAHATADSSEPHRYSTPSCSTPTPPWRVPGVTDQVRMSLTPGATSPCSCRAVVQGEWQARTEEAVGRGTTMRSYACLVVVVSRRVARRPRQAAQASDAMWRYDVARMSGSSATSGGWRWQRTGPRMHSVNSTTLSIRYVSDSSTRRHVGVLGSPSEQSLTTDCFSMDYVAFGS